MKRYELAGFWTVYRRDLFPDDEAPGYDGYVVVLPTTYHDTEIPYGSAETATPPVIPQTDE